MTMNTTGIDQTLELSDVNNKAIGMLMDLAIREGRSSDLQALLRNGADVNAERDLGWDDACTPLHLASAGSNVDVAKALLNHGAATDAVTAHNATPLHVAARRGTAEVASLLLERGADANAEDAKGASVLQVCVERGDLELTELVLRHCAVGREESRRILGSAVRSDAPDARAIIDMLLEAGVAVLPVDAGNCELFHVSVTKGLMPVIEGLLKLGADANMSCRGRTPLHCAAECGQTDVAMRLLRAGADVNREDSRGRRALLYAAERGDADMADVLLKAGAQDVGQVALHGACRAGHGDAAQVLLDHGGDVGEEATARNWTPLDTAHRSCRSKHATHLRCPFEVLQAHAVKLRTAGIPLSDRVASFLHCGVGALTNACECELQRLKETYVGDSRVTYGDFLTRGDLNLAKIVGNDEVVKAVHDPACDAMFPLYAALMRCQLKKALRRRALLHRCVLVLTRIAGRHLPDSVLWDHVLCHLDTHDLLSLSVVVRDVA